MDYQTRPLPLSEEQRTKVTDYLLKEITSALTDRSDLERKWSDWHKQFNARLEPNNPESGDSKLDMPLTPEYCGQTRARVINPIFQQDPLIVCHPRKPNSGNSALQLEQLTDYITDKAKMQDFCDSIFEDAQIFGVGFGKVGFTNTSRLVRNWTKEQRPILDQSGQPAVARSFDQMGNVVEQPMTEEVRVEQTVPADSRAGSFPERVSPVDMVFPSTARSLADSPWLDHRVWLSKYELRQRVRGGTYVADMQKIGSPSSAMPTIAVEIAKNASMDVGNAKLYEVHEIYTSLGVLRSGTEDEKICDGEDDAVEVIITIERGSKQILRAIYNFYHDLVRPFVSFVYKRGTDGIIGISQCFVLEPIHRAYSTSMNQSLDGGTLANSGLIVGRQGNDLGRTFKKGKIPRGWTYVETAGDIAQDIKLFQMNTGAFNQLGITQNELKSHANYVSSLSAGNFGEATSERPTATGQIRIMEESNMPLFMLLGSFRVFLASVVEMMLERYRQFYPDGLVYYIQQEEDGGASLQERILNEWPQGAISDSVIIETKVSSSTMNKNIRKQEKLAMVDKAPQLYQTLAGMITQGLTPQPSAPVWLKLAGAFQNLMADMFQEFEIANQDVVNPDLKEDINFGQSVIQPLLAQAQQLTAENEQLKSFIQEFSKGAGGLGKTGKAQGQQGPGSPEQVAPTEA